MLLALNYKEINSRKMFAEIILFVISKTVYFPRNGLNRYFGAFFFQKQIDKISASGIFPSSGF
jgi:hypothetical protein